MAPYGYDIVGAEDLEAILSGNLSLGADQLVLGADQLVLGYDPYGFDDPTMSGVDIVGAMPNPMALARRVVGNPQVRAVANMAQGLLRQRAQQQALASQRNNSMRVAAASQAARAGAILRPQEAVKTRRQPLGFKSSSAIAGGASATITVRPQNLAYKVRRMVIPATIAPMFDIDDLKVGNKSQLPQDGSIPGEAFLPNAEGAELDFDTCQTSQDLIIKVTNNSGGALIFKGSFYGTSVEA